jgi:hypothetical protein
MEFAGADVPDEESVCVSALFDFFLVVSGRPFFLEPAVSIFFPDVGAPSGPSLAATGVALSLAATDVTSRLPM